MDLKLKGKKAIVLGGSRGIGRAIADLLADEGADLAICARNPDQVAEAVASLRAKGVSAYGAAVDIADGTALKSWIADAASDLGGIDILISNASAHDASSTEVDWKTVFNLDMMGAVRSFESARPYLEAAASAHGDAAFIMISSVSAAETQRASAYGALKAALIHYAKGLAREHAALKIRTNVVSPGAVYFEGGVWSNIERAEPDRFKSLIARSPTGRMATPLEIASAAVFLASPLSSFTTGINMLVDGAITMRVNF
jgi:3-oxoacyl-[acyl-carrier protein] reductase